MIEALSMTDTRTPAQRRRIMQSVGTKDTGPELTVRCLLHKLGYRFRLHRKDLPGKPDIVFPGRKKAIFVHGCFWHAHGCRYGKSPKSRPEYWIPKLERNKQRDIKAVRALEDLGWKVLTVWQCETKDIDPLAVKLHSFLDEERKTRSTSQRESTTMDFPPSALAAYKNHKEGDI